MCFILMSTEVFDPGKVLRVIFLFMKTFQQGIPVWSHESTLDRIKFPSIFVVCFEFTGVIYKTLYLHLPWVFEILIFKIIP